MAASELRQANIVIVDDEQANVLVLEQLLRREGFANLLTTTDSSRAIELCERGAPDLLLLDLMMPDPDGFEVMRRLEPVVARSAFPILVLTADMSPEIRQRALATGAKDFLTKPFDRIEALLRIENLLETRMLQRQLEAQNRALREAALRGPAESRND